ncbi:peptidoglycan-binding protein [Streptomyces sp. NPDC015492]|uniref:peptidoglycan-binding domain-containing protein n=1 Tax=Streptomyces sp. NPDC015492 TaxID=3364958 RepID=UPI0036FD9754
MPDRTAAAATSAAPASEPSPTPGDEVFGKVALPGQGSPNALAQDLELFDATPPGPPAESGTAGPRARHRAGRPRYVRRSPRPRKATSAPRREWRSGMSMPLLITGALAAGFGLSVGLTSGMEREPADQLTVTMPDLPPHEDATDAEPSSTASAPTPTPPATARKATGTARPPVTVAPTAAVRPTRSASPGTTSRSSAPPTRAAAPRAEPTPSPSRTTPPAREEQPDGPLLRRGSTGPEVEELQRRLRRLHLYRGSTDGVFGPRLEAALSLFQSLHDIPEERGVYGPKTRAALRSETGRRGRGDDRGGSAGLLGLRGMG